MCLHLYFKNTDYYNFFYSYNCITVSPIIVHLSSSTPAKNENIINNWLANKKIKQQNQLLLQCSALVQIITLQYSFSAARCPQSHDVRHWTYFLWARVLLNSLLACDWTVKGEAAQWWAYLSVTLLLPPVSCRLRVSNLVQLFFFLI